MSRELESSSERDLREILDVMFGAVLVTDGAGVISFANHAATALLGYRREELVGLPIGRVLESGPEAAPGADPDQLIDDLMARPEEQSCLTKDGQRVPVLFSLTPLLDRAVQIKGLVCGLLDLTDRKRLEAELRQAQKLESMGTLSAGIAHELNTPIQFIGDNVQFARESFAHLTRFVAEARRLCARDPVSAGHLARLEAEIDLDFLLESAPPALADASAGIERIGAIVSAVKQFAGSDTTSHNAVDVNAVLRNCLLIAAGELRGVAEAALDLQPLVAVRGNESELNQLFLGVIVNAAHAIADAARGRPGSIAVSSRRHGDSAVVTIADDGCGIPPAIQARIYDPFFTTKAVGRGSGQGLTSARAIVGRHGGRIHFQSEVGLGTSFTIELPVDGASH
jgi:two-component system NtrC family sensor kinase